MPIFATTAPVILLGLAMVIWGGLGLSMSCALSTRALSFATLGFVVSAAIGLGFLVFPGLGVEALTLLAVAALLMDGIYSILLGTSLKERHAGWIGMFTSGVVALLVGFVILLGWPGTSSWSLGLCLGANFATTGLALVLLGRRSRT
jgi:uncharacterized membrane protein HdeD (DUF308 family)